MDIFKPRFLYTSDVTLVVPSYVDDAVILVATTLQKLTREVMRRTFTCCQNVGPERNMTFGLLKMVRLCFCDQPWTDLVLEDGTSIPPVNELHLLSY